MKWRDGNEVRVGDHSGDPERRGQLLQVGCAGGVDLGFPALHPRGAGWHGRRRIHGSVLHVDIRDGKIWIQHDGTERGIAEDLLESGVPKDHIVLAFHSPELRKDTEFAVG